MNNHEDEINKVLDEILDKIENNIFDINEEILDETDKYIFDNKLKPINAIEEVDLKAEAISRIGDKVFEELSDEYPEKSKEFINGIDIYIYALASVKDDNQFNLLIKFFEFYLGKEEACEMQKSFQEVIKQYRLLKEDEKFSMYVHEDNFDNIAYAIARRFFRIHSSKNVPIKERDANYVLKMPCLQPPLIKHIITKVSEWERDI